jgi:hypothetical protein
VIKVSSIDTRSERTGSFRNVGKITLKALAPPDFNPADAANNTSINWITVTGSLRATTPQTNTTWGMISTESVILELGPDAVLNLDTAPATLALNVGRIRNGAAAGDLFRSQSAATHAAQYVVEWSGTIPSALPASPTIWFGAVTGRQLSLGWSGGVFVLQQNPDLSNPNGWVNAPTGTNNPANVTIGSGNLFYRLKWPQ